MEKHSLVLKYTKKELFNMKKITNELIEKYKEYLFEEEKAPWMLT